MAIEKHFAERFKRSAAKPSDPKLSTNEQHDNITNKRLSKVVPVTLAEDPYLEERLYQRRRRHLEKPLEIVASLQKRNASLEEQRRFLHGKCLALEKKLKVKNCINRQNRRKYGSND